jgi:hypothetical protein
MLAVLLVFAGASYLLHGSLATTVWQTVLCAVILQAGYFIAVLVLVHREKLERDRISPERASMLREAEARRSEDLQPRPAPELKIGDH